MLPRSLVTLAGVAFLLAGCSFGGTKTTTVTVTTQASPDTGSLAQTDNARYFGKPVLVTQLDAKRYLLTITPRFFLVGVAANIVFAAQQQNACQPLECPGV